MRHLTLNFDGKDIDFTFGLGLIGEVIEETGFTLQEIIEKIAINPFKIVPLLMFHSASYVCKRRGEEIKFTSFDFTDWLDEDGGHTSPKIVEFCEAFTKSITKNVPKEEETVKGSGEKKS